MMSIQWLDWPVPQSVKACYTLRHGGYSQAPFDSFNLGLHVGDLAQSVDNNRRHLQEQINQANIQWLEQIHGTKVVEALPNAMTQEADAAFVRQKNIVCSVMTADCLPVFFCNTQGTQVAVAHAGWRGLLHGVLQNTLHSFSRSDTILAYLGPAIGPDAFEVGDEVREAFLSCYPSASIYFLQGAQEGKWLANLYGVARHILLRENLKAIYGGHRCTFREANDFFSYRRDNTTGRMANLIWLE